MQPAAPPRSARLATAPATEGPTNRQRQDATPAPPQHNPIAHTAPPPDLADIAEDTEGDDIFVTPPPAETGWPDIQGHRPGWQYENMTNAMTTSWQNRKFPHCLVAMAGEGACDPGEARRRTIQADAILRVFGIKAEIVQAQVNDPKRKRNDAPFFNMVQVAYPADVRRIVDAKCISIRDGPTLFFFPAKPVMPTFMANFERPEAYGARRQNPTRIVRKRMTRNAIRAKFVQIFKREMEITKSSEPTAEERADSTIQATTIELTTRFHKGDEIPLASVYCTVPLEREDTWLAVRDAFRTSRLGTDISGHPTLYNKPLKCAICHGIDHDTPMCKFPRTPDWCGPKADPRRDDDAEDDDADAAFNRGGKGKRGFKGRGRGRGGAIGFAPRGGRR